MKTISELEQENADLRKMIEGLKRQLLAALEEVARIHAKDLTCAHQIDRTQPV